MAKKLKIDFTAPVPEVLRPMYKGSFVGQGVHLGRRQVNVCRIPIVDKETGETHFMWVKRWVNYPAVIWNGKEWVWKK